jgi:hypothetical protein
MTALVEDTDEAKLWAAGKRILALEEEIELQRTKISNLRFALANIVDKDLAYDGHFVAAGEIVRAHILGGRRALTENPV